MRSGHRVDGRRVVDGNSEHKYVHLRNCSGVHSYGKRRASQNERNHRMEGR